LTRTRSEEDVYAQLFELPGAEPSARLERSINDELLPALRSEEGFCGALSLVRRGTGEMLVLVFWETEYQAASPLHPSVTVLLGNLGAAGPTSGVPTLWEVGARA
jgi:hypothetical protein